MERLLTKARDAGATIIHAPSGTMDTYDGTAARIRAQEAPECTTYPDGIDEWQYNSAREPRGTGSGPRDAQGPNAEDEGVQDGGYPIDQRDGGEDDDATEHAAWARALAAEGINPGAPWTGQTAALTIDEAVDYVTDSGSEVWNIMESRGIKNALLMGVHTNMCVLGRPFGLRQLARLGKNVALVRDMTDTSEARVPAYLASCCPSTAHASHVNVRCCDRGSQLHF
jgi:nicotinamidase-related amidase